MNFLKLSVSYILNLILSTLLNQPNLERMRQGLSFKNNVMQQMKKYIAYFDLQQKLEIKFAHDREYVTKFFQNSNVFSLTIFCSFYVSYYDEVFYIINNNFVIRNMIWFKNLRIRTQILLFSSCIIIIIFGIQFAILVVNLQMLQILIREQSAFVMSLDNYHLLNSSLSLITNYIQKQQQRTISKISSIHNMHQLIQNVDNYTSLQQYPNTCATSSIFEYNQVFCYFIYNQKSYQQSQTNSLDQYFNLVQQLDSFILSFYDAQVDQNLIYLGDNSDFKFTAFYPPGFYPRFDPTQTYPYTYHMEYIKSHPNQKIVFPMTQAVPSFQDQKILSYKSITTSLYTSNYTLNGMTGITFLPIQQYYNDIPYNILFVDSEEVIIMASVEWNVDYSQKNYIFAQENSGFNYQDWKEIYKFSQHKTYQSNCSIDIQADTLCRYNQFLEKEVIIQSYNFLSDNSTLIIMQNVTTVKLLDQQNSDLIASLMQEYFFGIISNNLSGWLFFNFFNFYSLDFKIFLKDCKIKQLFCQRFWEQCQQRIISIFQFPKNKKDYLIRIRKEHIQIK